MEGYTSVVYKGESTLQKAIRYHWSEMTCFYETTPLRLRKCQRKILIYVVELGYQSL